MGLRSSALWAQEFRHKAKAACSELFAQNARENLGIKISSKMAEEVEFVSDEDVLELKKRRESQRGTVHFVDHELVNPLYER